MTWITWTIISVAAYLGLVLFLARLASSKWHPDGGQEDESSE